MVVGIGASAGALKALRSFFEQVPGDSGLAFVVVVHLSPEHESHLADLLQPHVAIPVEQVNETVPLEPDHVYVIPPNANLSTIDTHLRLSELEKKRRERAPIDHFFRTLAETHDGHAMGVILSGTGSDGTLGVKDLKAKGGLVVVQDPHDAEYDGMPRSAIATGLVDLVLPVAEIPPALLQFCAIQPRVAVPQDDEAIEDETRRLLQKIFAQIRARTGRDFSRYKRSTILRRIARRMQLNHTEELEAYLELLRRQPEEVHDLADDLLVTVTSFFRDPETYEALAKEAIPRLFEDKSADDDIRVWSVGCATGEEAYSLAILLLEEAARRDVRPHIQLFASDLHEESLEQAREGYYSGDITTDVGEERLRRYFTISDNGGYRVRKEVRELVVFAPHNLLSDPPFSRLDLILCRNLLIYLQRDIQRDVMEIFHYALRKDGLLVLGTSETVDSAELFQAEEKKLCIYRKRNVPGPEPHLPVFPLNWSRAGKIPDPPEELAKPIAYGSLHQRMAEQYAPPSVLVGPDDKVVHVSEHAGRYLVHPGGELTTSVFKLVRDELRIELRALLHAAKEKGEVARSTPISVGFNGERRAVVLDVRPAFEPDKAGFALVIFDERPESAGTTEQSPRDGAERGRSRELEAELDLAKQRLQAVIEEYETSREEMRASNEELQSANEELRSTMEELETSKEELQSMNEELQTVNQENRHKVEELAQLSSDLQNLLAATDIATLFLDRKLRILRFTPRVGDLFNVRAVDRGRPISDLTHRLGYDGLKRDAEQVLHELSVIEHEIQDDTGRWYLTRILPYRTTEDRIEGVVITFVEITRRKRTEQALSESEELYRQLVESAQEYAIISLDSEGHIMTWNTGAKRIFGYSENEARGASAEILFNEEDRADDAFRREMEIARREGSATDERWYVRKDGERFWASGETESLHKQDGSLYGFAKVLRDNTERKEAEDALRRAKNSLERRVEQRTREVRELASRLTIAEQSERHRISRILHDDLQQLLYGVEMKLSMIREDLRESGEDKLEKAVEEAYGWTEEAVALSRSLTIDLSPPILQKEGLADALGWLQGQMAELHKLEVELEVEHESPIPDDDIRVLLFQVVRELLFNVTKHAGVASAKVQLGRKDGRILVRVIDEGAGFDADRLDACGDGDVEAGFGLLNIRERLELIGGTFRIQSQPGAGTSIEIEAPAKP